jgi:hypothetical protein
LTLPMTPTRSRPAAVSRASAASWRRPWSSARIASARAWTWHERRLQETRDERMRAVGRRAHLRHEQRRHVERVLGQLEHAVVAVLVDAGDAQPAVDERLAVLGVDAEAAVVALDDLGRAVQVRGARAGCQRDRQRLAGRRAGQRHQEQQ